MSFLLARPTIWSTFSPFLKMTMVGMALTLNLLATSGLLSTFTLAIWTESAISMASSARMGAMALQGPHHGAQKSTRMGFLEFEIVDSKEFESSSNILSEAI